MPKCKNDKTRNYIGNEPSPKGLGICAHVEKVGTIKEGLNKKLWIVIEQANSIKKWILYKLPDKLDQNEFDRIAYNIAINSDDPQYAYLKTPQVTDFNINTYLKIKLNKKSKSKYEIVFSLKNNIYTKVNYFSAYSGSNYTPNVKKKDLKIMEKNNKYYLEIDNCKDSIHFIIEISSNNKKYLDLYLEKDFKI